MSGILVDLLKTTKASQCPCSRAQYSRPCTLFGAAEYIQDTEEYINIELDSSRNRLIRLEVVINTATFSIAMYSLVAGEL